MKKTILALMLFVLTLTSVFAQQLTDGFETWPSPNWNLINVTSANPITQSSTYANTGTYSLRFSSISSGSPYDQYMVSNEINWTDAENEFSFYHRKGSGTELIAVGWSTTGNDVETDFTWTETIYPTTTWTQYLNTTLPAETKYVAIHYFSNYAYYCYIDDVVLGNPLAGTPDAPTLVSPVSGSINIAIDTNLEWTIGESTDHAVLYLADNAEFTDALIVNPATSPYTTSLNNGTTYFWKVVAVGPTAIEVESNVNSFTTQFNAITEFPYEQGFEMWPPAGWIVSPESGTGAWLQDDGTDYGPGVDNIYSGDYAAMFDNYSYSNGTIGVMETPPLDLSSMTAPLVKFYWWNNDGTYGDLAQLNVYTKVIDGEWVLVENIDVYGSGATSWVESSNLITTDVRFIKLEAVSDFGSKNTFVDAFTIEEAPTAPIVEINTDPIEFGTLALNEASDSEIVSIQNIGGGTLNITDISITGTDADQFAYTDSEDYALAATEDLLIEVTFNPTSAGEKIATLQITDDLSRQVYEVALSGTGLDTNIYEINIPYSQGFEIEEEYIGWTSNLLEGSSSSKSERYESSSAAHSGDYSHRFYHPYNYSTTMTSAELISPVVIPDMDTYRTRFWAKKTSLSNSDQLIVGKYNQAMDTFTALDSIDLTTTYAEYTVEMASPARANERIAFQYSTDVSYSSNTVYIDDITFEEIPEGAVIQITPESFDFESVFVGYEAMQTFTVTNNGVIAASITEATVPAGYSTETEVTFPYALEAGASFTVDVTFAPQAEMIYSGNLRVKEENPDNPFVSIDHDVALTGSGIPVPQGANCSNPLALTFPAEEITGNTADYIDDYSSTWITPSSSYMNGDDVVYQFTFANAMLLNGSISTTDSWMGAFILADEPNEESPAEVLLTKSASSSPLTYTNEMIPAGTYYLIISSYPSPQSVEYTINLTADALPAPAAATSPTPADAAIDQPTALTLSWDNADYTETIDLYFGTAGAREMALVLDDVAAVEEYAVTDLDPSTEYAWKVINRNYSGETADTLVTTWTFTTVGSAPDAVNYTSPADVATNRPITGNLTWSAATGANGYYVYLSTDQTFAGVTPEDQATTSYEFSGLDYETTYYWKVIPYNVVGQATEGIEVWSFTTIPDPSIELPVIVTFDGSTSMPAEIVANNMGISATHGNNSNGLYKNIYGSYPDAYAQFQVMRNVEADTELNFEYRIMAYSGYPGAAHTIIEGEYIRVKVSTDGGANYDTAYEINSANHVVSTDFANVSVPLGAYAGQYITVRLEARREAGDYYVDFDNFYFRVPPTTPLVDLSTESIDFGQVVLGDTSDPESVTITNIGSGTLNISGIAINGTNAGEFAYSTADGASMALGFNESLTIDVTTTPSISGALVASLDITDDMDRSVTSIALTASGYDATITGPFFNGLENDTDVLGWNVNLESTSDYATAGRYSSSSLANTGTYSFRVYCPSYATTSAELISPVITPDLNDYRVKFWAKGVGTIVVGKYNQAMDSFTAIDTISTLAEYSYNEYTVELTAARTNERIAFQFATSSTNYSSKYIYLDDLTFEEIPQNPIASLSASEIDFGVTFLNQTASEDVSITNVGAGTLNITAIEIYGPNADDFAYSTADGASMALATDESLVITLDFTPTAEGLRDATLQITDDLGNRFRFNSATKNTNNSRNLNFITLSGNCLDPVIRTLPFTEGFEENNTHNSTDVALWSQVSEVGSGLWTINETLTSYNRTPRTGSYNVTLRYSNTDWLFRAVELTAGQAYDFELYARQDGATATNSDVGLYYGTEATSATMVSITGQVGIVNGEYQLISGTFTPETSGIYYLGIKGYMNGSPWYISIDDITIKESEAVVVPEIPTNVSITTDGAIIISWEAAANANSYNVYACDTPDGDYTDTPIASVSELSYTYTGSENMKFFKVKASSDVIDTPAKGFRRQ